jgi:hypothetical protein
MSHRVGSALRSCSLILAVALAGCSASDPATEAPVELLPGQYQIRMSGGGLAAGVPTSQGPGAVDDSVCIARADDSETVSKLARQYLGMHPGCSHSANDRVGNSVSGKLSCPTDPERAPGGAVTTTYTGALTAESVTLEGKVSFDIPQMTAGMSPEEQAQIEQGMKVMESISIVVKAERTGDCT